MRPPAHSYPRFRGTRLPFFRASESPMAMACLRLFTRPPLPPFPLRSLPRFRLRIALSTSWLALRLYFRRPFRRAIANPPVSNESAPGLEAAIDMPREKYRVSHDNRDDVPVSSARRVAATR